MSFLRETISQQFTDFVTLKPPPPGRWKVALRTTTCVAVAMVLVAVVVDPRLATVGLISALVCTTAGARPWRVRVVILAAMNLAYAAGCAIAAFVGGSPVLLTAFLVILAASVALAYHAFLPDPPGPVFLIIGPVLASYLPTVGIPPSKVIAVSVLAAVSASAMNLLINARSSSRPEETAIADVETEVDLLLAGSTNGQSRTELAQRRNQAYASVFAASLVLDEASPHRTPDPHFLRLNRRLRQLHRQVVVSISHAEFPGAKVHVSALEQRQYLGAPGARYLLRWGISRRSFPWFAARRLSLAIALSCLIAYSLRSSHPYWTVMTTALVMSPGSDRLALTHRGLHRLVGTVAGLAIFGLLHLAGFHGIDLVVVVLVLEFIIQMTVVRNYALGVVFVTPLALLVATSTRSNVPILPTVADRVLDTAIGVGASLLVMWLTGYRTPVALVRRQYRRTLRAVERLLLLLAAGKQTTETGFVARRDLAYEQLQASRILSIAQQELPARLAGWDSIEQSVNQLSYTVLSACWLVDPAASLDARRMAGALQHVLAELPRVNTEPIDLAQLRAELLAVRQAGVPDPASDADAR